MSKQFQRKPIDCQATLSGSEHQRQETRTELNCHINFWPTFLGEIEQLRIEQEITHTIQVQGQREPC